MCVGVAVALSGLPVDLVGEHGLGRRVHDRGGEKEVQFLYRDREPLLPVWHEGRLLLARWGCRRGDSRVLPCTGWTLLSTVERGGWNDLDAAEVDIQAAMGWENGVWFRIRRGVRGVLVRDERGRPTAYMVCEPASHYYAVMTRSKRMPALIGERI
jgi:hypothetical protein